MRILNFIILYFMVMIPCAKAMELDEIEINLKTGNESDFMDTANQIDVLIRKADAEKKIKIARILYEYRNKEDQTIVSEDEIYSFGRRWAISRMARLTSYEDHLPDDMKNQFTPEGFRIDPLGTLSYDSAAQDKFLRWYEERFGIEPETVDSIDRKGSDVPSEHDTNGEIDKSNGISTVESVFTPTKKNSGSNSELPAPATERVNRGWFWVLLGAFLASVVGYIFWRAKRS